jgi:hypothetical protein
VIGIDIGKNSFHVVVHNARGAIVLRQKWSRGQVEARLANIPPCLICESAWGAGTDRHAKQLTSLIPAGSPHRADQGGPARDTESSNAPASQLCFLLKYS